MEHDQFAQDKRALRKSQAGMRLIAQTHIYNGGNWERLRRFIADSYHEEQLAQQATPQRLQALQALYEQVGRLKIKQVLASNEHHVIVILDTEKTATFYYTEMKAEEDYPHKITFFMQQPMQAAD